MAIDKAKNKEEFIALLKSTGRDGVDYVIEDLESLGFFDAPAAAAHHLNVDGGLVQHSLNTYHAAKAVLDGMSKIEPSLVNEVKPDSLIIAALLHDVCKADLYVNTTRRRKNNLGEWEEVPGYRASYRNFPAGHGEKSVIVLLSSGLDLHDDEILAIRWHMGGWGVNMLNAEECHNYDAARKLYPLVAIVQCGDSLAATLMERTGEEVDNL